MRKLSFILMIYVGASFLSLKAFAHVSSVSAGAGATGRGVSDPLENPYLNPAALPFQRGYFFGTGFARTSNKLYGNQDLFSVALTDNMPETILPTSIAFTESKNIDLGREGLRRDIRLGIGNFYNTKMALGFALNYRMSRTPVFSKQQFNAVLGAMFPVRKEIGIGLVFENLFPSDSAIPESERLEPTISLGASYNYLKFVRVRADLISQPGNSFGKPVVGLGIENYWNRWIIFRLGAQRDPGLDKSIESIGIGFAGPKFELQYAYQSIRGALVNDGRHSIDLGLPIW